jgi:hypothetical protein
MYMWTPKNLTLDSNPRTSGTVTGTMTTTPRRQGAYKHLNISSDEFNLTIATAL